MIEHYLSSNNEMCYSTKTQFFSPTKHRVPYHVVLRLFQILLSLFITTVDLHADLALTYPAIYIFPVNL